MATDPGSPPLWTVHCSHPAPPEESIEFRLDGQYGPRIILCRVCYRLLRASMEDFDGRQAVTPDSR